MSIVDEDNFLTKEERKDYFNLLKTYGFAPQYFLLEVTEDQNAMDMNDINYVIIIKVRTTQVETEKSRTYWSSAESGTWIDEFEEDLKSGYFQ